MSPGGGCIVMNSINTSCIRLFNEIYECIYIYRLKHCDDAGSWNLTPWTPCWYFIINIIAVNDLPTQGATYLNIKKNAARDAFSATAHSESSVKYIHSWNQGESTAPAYFTSVSHQIRQPTLLTGIKSD